MFGKLLVICSTKQNKGESKVDELVGLWILKKLIFKVSDIKKAVPFKNGFQFLNNKTKKLTATRSRTASHTFQTGSVSNHRHTLAFGADITSVASFNCHLNFGVHFSLFARCSNGLAF